MPNMQTAHVDKREQSILLQTLHQKGGDSMRFQCVDINCGRPFGWTAKKIIKTYATNESTILPEETTYEYVVCPYCGSLDFEEGNSQIQKKLKEVPVPPVQMPKPVQMKSQFDPSDLMQHNWKKGKRKPDKTYDVGSLAYGWDFKDQFKPETLDALARGPINIDQYVISLQGNFVSTKKV